MKGYRLYTVVPRLVEFIEELTNWYVRLNRDRLKGRFGNEEAVLGLNVLFEVLLTMTQVSYIRPPVNCLTMLSMYNIAIYWFLAANICICIHL